MKRKSNGLYTMIYVYSFLYVKGLATLCDFRTISENSAISGGKVSFIQYITCSLAFVTCCGDYYIHSGRTILLLVLI